MELHNNFSEAVYYRFRFGMLLLSILWQSDLFWSRFLMNFEISFSLKVMEDKDSLDF